MTLEKQIVTIRCPACQARIQTQATLMPGDYLCCPECDKRLEVVRVKPLVLDWEAEEWDKRYRGTY